MVLVAAALGVGCESPDEFGEEFVDEGLWQGIAPRATNASEKESSHVSDSSIDRGNPMSSQKVSRDGSQRRVIASFVLEDP